MLRIPHALNNSTVEDWWLTTFPRGRQFLTIQDANDQPVAIAYGEKGTGKPLVLVHGIASWSYAWHLNIDELAKHFRVICFDAKGSGFSDKPSHPEQPGHKVIELMRVVEALCDQPAIAVAESLGALATLAAVQTQPKLFERLVLLNVPLFLKQLPHVGMSLLANLPLDLVRPLDRWQVAKLLAPTIREVVYAFRGEVVTEPSQITPEHVYRITYPQIELPGTLTKLVEEFQLAAQEIHRLVKGQPNLISSVQAQLPQVTCPTLVLWAEHDQWFPVEDGKKLCDRLPNAQLQIIPNCGHYAAGSQPEFVNSAILSFLADTQQAEFSP